MNHILKDKLRQAEETGTLQLKEGDLRGSAAAGTEAAPRFQDVKGTIDTPVPKEAVSDQMMNAGAGVKESTGVTAAAGKSAPAGQLTVPDDAFLPETVPLTDADRDAFLDALVTGERYRRPFSLFDGRVTGTFRCRSAKESEAIAGWMNIGIQEKRFSSAFDYSVELRNALLAAQVESLNGTVYTELEAPLFRTASAAGTVEPRWLAQAEAWGLKPEALISAVYEEARLFDRKYWTMVVHARDQDFWHPAGST